MVCVYPYVQSWDLRVVFVLLAVIPKAISAVFFTLAWYFFQAPAYEENYDATLFESMY